jgi:hypothetical protein
MLRLAKSLPFKNKKAMKEMALFFYLPGITSKKKPGQQAWRGF